MLRSQIPRRFLEKPAIPRRAIVAGFPMKLKTHCGCSEDATPEPEVATFVNVFHPVADGGGRAIRWKNLSENPFGQAGFCQWAALRRDLWRDQSMPASRKISVGRSVGRESELTGWLAMYRLISVPQKCITMS